MPAFSGFATPLTESLSAELRTAIAAAPMPPLGEGTRQPALITLLRGGIGDHLIDVPVQRQMECLSGFWLVAGDIDESHSISQDLPSAEGSFLHGIMHRREADFGNAKYWFRRVGSHPVYDTIGHETGGRFTDPFDFVDRCEHVAGSGDEQEILACMEAQWIEWQALMMHVISH